MEKGGVSSMDASIQDVWEWEVLPDEHRSFYAESRPVHAHGGQVVGDQDTEEPILPPPSDDTDVKPVDDECKDIGVVAPAETKSSQEESMASDGEEAFESSDAKALDDEPGEVTPKQYAEEEEDGAPAARPECVVFSVGKLRFNGIGALCSFGVAAATVCIFLVGGRLQHQQKQQQKIQLQFLGDDKRMQQVVQQTSRLNQAMSSLMGGGASTRANISFGGFYDGF